jgi:hypothetical protein
MLSRSRGSSSRSSSYMETVMAAKARLRGAASADAVDVGERPARALRSRASRRAARTHARRRRRSRPTPSLLDSSAPVRRPRAIVCGNRDASKRQCTSGSLVRVRPEEAMTTQDRVKHGTRLPISAHHRDRSASAFYNGKHVMLYEEEGAGSSSAPQAHHRRHAQVTRPHYRGPGNRSTERIPRYPGPFAG